jgi:hypothetical protein
MADFIKLPETPPIQPEQAEKEELPLQEAQEPSNVVEGNFPQQENQKQVQATPDQESEPQQDHTGRIVSLKERVQETPRDASALRKDVEQAMSERSKKLVDLYKELDQATQVKVKDEGEKAAIKIESLLEKGIENGVSDDKSISDDVLKIIRKWMEEIPGVSKFFLEQESKLITDEVIGLMRNTIQGLDTPQEKEYKEAA